MDLNQGDCEPTYPYPIERISYYGISVLGRSGVYGIVENVVQCNLVETKNCVSRFSETGNKIRVARYQCSKRENQTRKGIGLKHTDEFNSITKSERVQSISLFLHQSNFVISSSSEVGEVFGLMARVVSVASSNFLFLSSTAASVTNSCFSDSSGKIK